jgi:hypothetical protein
MVYIEIELPTLTRSQIDCKTVEKYKHIKFLEIFVIDQPYNITQKVKLRYTIKNSKANNALQYGYAVYHWG